MENDREGLILYTSGTTGVPKGVVITHGQLKSQVTALCKAWEWSENDSILNVLPLHHIHGLVNVCTCCLYSGGTLELFGKFEAKRVWTRFFEEYQRKQCRAEGPYLTLFMGVPTIYSLLIREYDNLSLKEREDAANAFQGLRLMVSGSSALPTSISTRWTEISGHHLLERYGMTEVGMALSNPLHGSRIPGQVGTPLPGVQIRIVDGNHIELPSGHSGELLIKGNSVFKEYLKKPEETASSFVDGWFKTGDIAEKNPESGAIKILGRASVDIIKCGGFKISALEIEQVLSDHPKIQEVAVVGKEDHVYGQKICAVVGLKEGDELSLNTLRDWAKDKISDYKLPHYCFSLPKIPRNAMGKVNKKTLLQTIQNPETSTG